MGILTIILTALGALPNILGALKTLFTDAAKLFDDLGQAKAASVTQQAVDITGTAETKANSVKTWFDTEFPNLEKLLEFIPGLPKLVYSAHNIKADQGVDLHTAITAAQLGANTVKQAQS